MFVTSLGPGLWDHVRRACKVNILKKRPNERKKRLDRNLLDLFWWWDGVRVGWGVRRVVGVCRTLGSCAL